MAKKLKQLIARNIILVVFLTSLVSIAYANSDCPEDERACIEWSDQPVCEKTPNEDCIDRKKEAEGTNVEIHCNEYIEQCHIGFSDETCIEWGCEGDIIFSDENIEKRLTKEGVVVSSVPVQEESVISEPKEEREVIVVMPEEPCEACPTACKYIENDNCGICNCPDNLGLCDSTGLRNSINNTNAYCFGGLWFEQKEDNQTCQNSFECVSNFCSKELCYDISSQVEENKSILQSILDWIKRLFGM